MDKNNKNNNEKNINENYINSNAEDVKNNKDNVKKYICIHGHFYQPYRKNPWIEKIEMQENLFPYHDWNEKITAECYSANSCAHILNPQNEVDEIINNYSKISFNFGPTLLEWLKENDTITFNKIIQADKQSLNYFSNHGSAIAQVYNHIIMPLADKNDKYLQVYWAIKDFEDKFKRKPEGIWLAETAVDLETLEVLANQNIKFTILSPDQAKRVRKIQTNNSNSGNVDNNSKATNNYNAINDNVINANNINTNTIISNNTTNNNQSFNKNDNSHGNGNDNNLNIYDWIDVSGGKINTRMPYLCKLPSGKTINIFFYDKQISVGISFGDLLTNGEKFANCLINAPSSFESNDVKNQRPEIVIVASDGETYGHHKKFGDMALAYCIKTIEKNDNVKLTVFGEYLENYPPDYEVEIIENTAWSCAHALDRWKCDCECALDKVNHPNWNQKWRAPLRQAIDLLRKKINEIFEKEIINYTQILPLPEYINVINDRSYENINNFLNRYLKDLNDLEDLEKNKNNDTAVNEDRKIKFLSLLEMQRQAMLMQSSDGWFFDDIYRVESIQILKHAARAIELAKEVNSKDSKNLQQMILDILVNAKSNVSENINGATIYNNLVLSAIYNPQKVAAHLATILLFNNIKKKINTYEKINKNLTQNQNQNQNNYLNSSKDKTLKNYNSDNYNYSYDNSSYGIYDSICDDTYNDNYKDASYDSSYENKNYDIKNNSLFENATDSLVFDFYSYMINVFNLKYLQNDKVYLISGKITLISKINLKKSSYYFLAISNMGDYNSNYLIEKIFNNSSKFNTSNVSNNNLSMPNEANKPNISNASNSNKPNTPNNESKLNNESDILNTSNINTGEANKDFKKDINNADDNSNFLSKNLLTIYIKEDNFTNLNDLNNATKFSLNDLDLRTKIQVYKIIIDNFLNDISEEIINSNNFINLSNAYFLVNNLTENLTQENLLDINVLDASLTDISLSDSNLLNNNLNLYNLKTNFTTNKNQKNLNDINHTKDSTSFINQNIIDIFSSPWINYKFIKPDSKNLILFANKILIYNLLNKNNLNHEDIEILLNLININITNINLFNDFDKSNLKVQQNLLKILIKFLNYPENENILKDAANLLSIISNLKIDLSPYFWQIQNILFETQDKIIKLKLDAKVSNVTLSQTLIKDFSYLLDYFKVANKIL